MYHIKSVSEFELLRLISYVHDSLPDFEIELIRLIREKNFETLFSKVHAQVTHTSMYSCLGLKLDSSGWSGMHLIKSGFELELLRLIRHVKNFISVFQIELIRLIRKKIFETLFSKVRAQVTQTSMCSCLGVKYCSSAWSGISSSLALNWNYSDLSDMCMISSLPFKLSWSD